MKKNTGVWAQARRINSRVETIRKNIGALPEQVREIVVGGQEVARSTLERAAANPDFTQMKVPIGQMVSCIIVEEAHYENSHRVRLVIAPTDTRTYWNMYFAEYGAGVGKDKNATAYWTAVAKEVIATGKKHKSWNSKRNEGYWYFKDYNGEIHMVNTSTKVRYMQEGIKHIRNELKKFTK